MHLRKQMDLDALMPTITEVIDTGGSFRLYPRGFSMLPLLVQGEDSVTLVKAEPYTVGDVLLYRRKNGQFVLHRLIALRGDTLVLCGDHQHVIEYGLPRQAVLAKMSGYYKGEVYHSVEEEEYLRYARARVTRFPWIFRKSETVFRLYRRFTPISSLPRRAVNKLRRMLGKGDA